MPCIVETNHSNTGVKSATAGTTFTISNPSTLAARFIVIVVTINSGSVTVSSIDDGGANTYSRIGSPSVNGALTTEVWSGPVSQAAGGSANLTITLSATGTLAAGVAGGYLNVLSIGSGTGVTGSSSPITTGSVALTPGVYSFLFFGGGMAAANAFTAQNGVLRNQTTTTGLSVVAIDSAGNPTPTTDSATMTAAAWSGVYFEIVGDPVAGGGGLLRWGAEADTGLGGGGTSIQVSDTVGNGVNAGDLIVVIFRTNEKGATLTCSDNVNPGNYSIAYDVSETVANPSAELVCFYMPNSLAAAAGVLAITVTTTLSGALYCGCLVYGGMASAPFDGAASTPFTSTTNPSSGSVTPTVFGDVAVGSATAPTSLSVTISVESSGFMEELDDRMGSHTAGAPHCHSADSQNIPVSAITYSPTFSLGNAGVIGIALFKAGGDSVTETAQYQLR